MIVDDPVLNVPICQPGIIDPLEFAPKRFEQPPLLFQRFADEAGKFLDRHPIQPERHFLAGRREMFFRAMDMNDTRQHRLRVGADRRILGHKHAAAEYAFRGFVAGGFDADRAAVTAIVQHFQFVVIP